MMFQMFLVVEQDGSSDTLFFKKVVMKRFHNWYKAKGLEQKSGD
jgi:hypothetical protein